MYTTKKLSNGLRVIFAPLHDTDAVTVLAMTKVGSRYETARNNGVSHFLEHMMFKGTEKRPTARDVSKELDGVGASFNAFTSKDYTGYYIKLGGDHLALAMDIVADMLWHSKFLTEEIDRERHVITEEINMYEDNPIMHVEEKFEESLFGATHPLGRLISGPKSNIARMARKDIVGYFQSHYFPANMVLCVAGKFPAASTLREIQSLFGGRGVRRRAPGFTPFHVTQRQPRLALLTRDTEQVQVALGFPALPYLHKDVPALTLLAVILGGNMSSRLFTRVREQEGLAYSIHASRSSFTDTGAFVVQAGLDKTRLLPALKLIVQELRSAADHGVTDDELAHAKEFIRGKLTIELEDSESLANFLASQQLLTGTIKTPEQKFAELACVRKPDLQRVARTVFCPERLTTAIIGPVRSKSAVLVALRG